MGARDSVKFPRASRPRQDQKGDEDAGEEPDHHSPPFLPEHVRRSGQHAARHIDSRLYSTPEQGPLEEMEQAARGDTRNGNDLMLRSG